jgi:hypothetical protein
MQYSDYILDTLTAPRLTSLTACGAVEVPVLPDYETILKLNQVLGGVRYKHHNAVVLIMTFIRRLKTAISEYNQGCQFLRKYVDAQPGNHLLDAHRVALAHFENSILQLHVAIVSVAALGGGTRPGKAKLGRPQLYVCGDNSDYDRIRLLCNSIKHFDEEVERAAQSNAPVLIAPLWITNDGFECSKNAKLSFWEIKAIFEDQAKDAETFSNVYLRQRS